MTRWALQVGLLGLAVVIVGNVLARATVLEWSLFDPEDAPSIGFPALGDLLVLGAIAAGVPLIRLRHQV